MNLFGNSADDIANTILLLQRLAQQNCSENSLADNDEQSIEFPGECSTLSLAPSDQQTPEIESRTASVYSVESEDVSSNRLSDAIHTNIEDRQDVVEINPLEMSGNRITRVTRIDNVDNVVDLCISDDEMSVPTNVTDDEDTEIDDEMDDNESCIPSEAEEDSELSVYSSFESEDLKETRNLMQNGNSLAALVRLDKILRLNPDYETALILRGNILIRQGDLWRAVSDFERALSLNADNRLAQSELLETLMCYGRSCLFNKDCHEAIKTLRLMQKYGCNQIFVSWMQSELGAYCRQASSGHKDLREAQWTSFCEHSWPEFNQSLKL